jgi:SPX domain protein involved in polyphosphate accumulation
VDYPSDGGSEDDASDGGFESFDALEERYHDLEEEVATLVADVHDLALYTKLNITGFMKILKVGDDILLPLDRMLTLATF